MFLSSLNFLRKFLKVLLIYRIVLGSFIHSASFPWASWLFKYLSSSRSSSSFSSCIYIFYIWIWGVKVKLISSLFFQLFSSFFVKIIHKIMMISLQNFWLLSIVIYCFCSEPSFCWNITILFIINSFLFIII